LALWPGAPPVRLSQALALRSCLDVDRDGVLVLPEAAALGIDGEGFGLADEDGDGALGADEFLVALCPVLGQRGLRAAPDLAAEALRLQARGRARDDLGLRPSVGASPPPGHAKALREIELEIRRGRLTLASLGREHPDAQRLRAALDRLEAHRMLLLHPPAGLREPE